MKDNDNKVCSTFAQKDGTMLNICGICGQLEVHHYSHPDKFWDKIYVNYKGEKVTELKPAQVEDLTIHFPKNKKWVFEGVKDGQYQFRKGMFFIGIDPDDEFLSYFDKCEIGSEVEIKITTV